MQILPAWQPVACNMNRIEGILHATAGHGDTICVRLAATQVQFTVHATGNHSVTKQVTGRQEVCKKAVFTSSTHASDYSADGPWMFDLENALVLWMM
jgi:hypothetical protein